MAGAASLCRSICTPMHVTQSWIPLFLSPTHPLTPQPELQPVGQPGLSNPSTLKLQLPPEYLLTPSSLSPQGEQPRHGAIGGLGLADKRSGLLSFRGDFWFLKWAWRPLSSNCSLRGDLLVVDTLLPSATSQLLESQDKEADPRLMAVLPFVGSQAEMKFNYKVSLVPGEWTQKLNSWSQKLKPDADCIASWLSSLQEQSHLAAHTSQRTPVLHRRLGSPSRPPLCLGPKANSPFSDHMVCFQQINLQGTCLGFKTAFLWKVTPRTFLLGFGCFLNLSAPPSRLRLGQAPPLWGQPHPAQASPSGLNFPRVPPSTQRQGTKRPWETTWSPAASSPGFLHPD